MVCVRIFHVHLFRKADCPDLATVDLHLHGGPPVEPRSAAVFGRYLEGKSARWQLSDSQSGQIVRHSFLR